MRGYHWAFAIAGLIGVSLLAFTSDDGDYAGADGTTLARQAAIQGLNDTAKKLVADSANWSVNPDKYAFRNASMGDAQYSTEVVAPYGSAALDNGCSVDTVDVVSVAALEDGDSHTIEATYVRSCDDDMGIRLVNFAER